MSDLESTGELNQLWARLAVTTCLSRGASHFFLAPGSRCTPLTLAVAEQEGIKAIQHFDERGLAFSCLGYGRATGKPGVFICTSGTAVANAYPAVIEASLEHVPMLLLTADRPPELRDTGANQTIDQCRIFGPYTRWFCDLPCPTPMIDTRLVRAEFEYALENAKEGPVQVNCMFREPFTSGTSRGRPQTQHSPVRGSGDVRWKAAAPGGNTWVVVGGCRRPDALAAARMAERWNCPLLADVTSSVRGLAYNHALYLPDPTSPRTVVHVGGRLTSKRLLQFLDENPPEHYWHLSPHPQRIDPIARQTERIAGNTATICDGLELAEPSDPDFLATWQDRSERCQSVFREQLDTIDEISEPGVARAVARTMPRNHGLFLGNSLPIREMDQFGFWDDDRCITVGANRGASGIDGIIASAYGFARGLEQSLTLIVGDLSFLHDLNSLALLSQVSLPFVAIVINNNGGGIFHFLPIAEQANEFEKYFATPHGLEFSQAARMFSLNYANAESISQFTEAYRHALERSESTVIEVKTNRRENRRIHDRIRETLRPT